MSIKTPAPATNASKLQKKPIHSRRARSSSTSSAASAKPTIEAAPALRRETRAAPTTAAKLVSHRCHFPLSAQKTRAIVKAIWYLESLSGATVFKESPEARSGKHG